MYTKSKAQESYALSDIVLFENVLVSDIPLKTTLSDKIKTIKFLESLKPDENTDSFVNISNLKYETDNGEFYSESLDSHLNRLNGFGFLKNEKPHLTDMKNYSIELTDQGKESMKRVLDLTLKYKESIGETGFVDQFKAVQKYLSSPFYFHKFANNLLR